MKYFLLLLFSIFSLVFSTVPARAAADSTYPKQYQTEVMNKLNEQQKIEKKAELIADPKLCELAELVANDSEVAYPNEIGNSWFSNPSYKKLLGNYSRYESQRVSKLDMLLEFEDASGGIQPFSQEDAESSFVGSESNGILLDSKITAGCVGISQGRVKPFMIFVGAEKKDTSLKGRVQTLWRLIVGMWS